MELAVIVTLVMTNPANGAEWEYKMSHPNADPATHCATWDGEWSQNIIDARTKYGWVVKEKTCEAAG